ncbi:hypothetical protein C8R43DRAFT_883829 [Mycena crocata]|nr:hypothetical protein C8R43DRAFT_883829 [Mycena crocata]
MIKVRDSHLLPSVIWPVFDLWSKPDRALDHLIQLGAHIPDEITRDVRSKLAIRTSDHTPLRTKDDKTNPVEFTRWRRVIQCLCGTDNTEGHRSGERRDLPWENVGCSFWMKLTTTHTVGPDSMILTVDEILGHLTHSAECQALTEMHSSPHIPLHPELREYALSLLWIRVPLSQLKSLCRDWAQNKWGNISGNNLTRYVLNPHETTTLYRTLAREKGISQAPPQDNLDRWFRKENPIVPDPRLTASRLFYQPHVPGETDRFIPILSSPEQRAMAWCFGHKKQMLMDLTFGVCSGRVLVAVLMVIDDHNHGIPVATMLFSAKKEAKAVHADYNGKLMEKVLGHFKDGMGKNEAGEAFECAVGTTDNDPRERSGLQHTWLPIILLLCMFHTWQAWRNGLNKHLRGIPKGEDRQSIRTRLGAFLMCLLKEITDYNEAVAAYNTELAYFRSLTRKRDKISKQQGASGLAFLAYLQGYLKHREFWESWSLAGVQKAAEKLGIPASLIARTTNHLESFNGRLKGKFFAHHMHSGRLPRVDHWVLILLTEALPTFFAEWAETRQRLDYYTSL